MSSNTLIQPGAMKPDPDAQVGYSLVALERRAWWLTQLKIAIVWIVLVAIIFAALLVISFEPRYMLDHIGIVLKGVRNTVTVSLLSIVFASTLALLGALGRLSKNAVAQGVSGLYVSIVRGTPLLIQIFLIYFGLAQIGVALNKLGLPGDFLILDPIPAGILALSINYGAYMTEIFRAGLQSIGHGQWEAATAIGMTRSQALRRIIMPQAVRIIIPDIGNQFIAMQKDSALISVIGAAEISWYAQRFSRQDSKHLEMYILAALMYWILTILSAWILGYFEKRMGHAYER
jgi:polar amino acid transport system permease protein